MEPWEILEENVRKIAQLKWGVPCTPEHLHGIDFDGVCKISDEHWVLVEVSTHNDLTKMRTDLAKFSAARAALFAESIYPECYFVTTASDRTTAKETAESLKIKYHTFDTFSATMIGAQSYVNTRREQPFGSAVTSDGTESDSAPYVQIGYEDSSRTWSLEEVASGLKNGENFILVGEFGSGKSRAVMELFNRLSSLDSTWAPLAINLKEAWGKRTMNSMVREHLEELGLKDHGDAVIGSLIRGYTPVLLDGFDELGSQSWSREQSVLRDLRWKATAGIRDILAKASKCGFFITGREHYFASDEEMISSLGLPPSVHVLRCPAEFTPKQAQEYLTASNMEISVPDWLPRKPLMCQLLVSLEDSDLDSLLTSSHGEVEFFTKSLDAVCRREARTASQLDESSIKELIVRLAMASVSDGAVQTGLDPAIVNREYRNVTGESPEEESAVILQRLPYLGRVQAGSPSRVFVDEYLRDGFVGLAYTMLARHEIEWTDRPSPSLGVGDLGVRVIASILAVGEALAFARSQVKENRDQAAADMVTSLLASTSKSLDFQGVGVDNCVFKSLYFGNGKVLNLSISNSYFETLDLDGRDVSNVHISGGCAQKLVGVGSSSDIPEFISGLEVECFESVFNTSAISQLQLTDAQKTLLSIVQKLFFQSGSGRMEQALLRGADRFWDAKAAERILSYMLKEGLISKFKGREGSVYSPDRSATTRMAALRADRTSSTDPIWKMVSEL